MAGTHNITQTRPSYICQSITSTGPGESALNALETISVASIAEDAIATVMIAAATLRALMFAPMLTLPYPRVDAPFRSTDHIRHGGRRVDQQG